MIAALVVPSGDSGTLGDLESPAGVQELLRERALAAAEAVAPGGVTLGPLDDAARLGGDPLLVLRALCPRVSAAHARAALADLDAGCGLSLGSTLEGDWYVAALRPELADLLTLPFQEAFQGAARRGVEVGLLPHERALRTAADAAAFAADPLTAPELRAALSAW